ncbi:hypothetical protein H2200_011624 [Cladophialophora chaetospira]|uniref:Xylanolytic transcriptional activator regulatory domain-containing protein n=1 Tax=Cladophialophora chaetospira TaxID=386627 RepID=A0AA39CDB7_9EURO|nr:hypothetical protein H2200_011624 [Cladophialophora chaetospira]
MFELFVKRSPVDQSVNGELSVLARLKRLEDVVLGRSLSQPNGNGVDWATASAINPHALAFAIDGHVLREPNLACLLADRPSPASEYQDDVHALEGTGARDAPWTPRGLDIRILSTHQIAVDQDRLFQLEPASKCICLPPKAEATLLVDHYFDYIDHLQHVVHVPTVQAMIRSVYANLESGLPVAPSDVVLLLAIFASAAALSTYFPVKAPSFMSGADALQTSTFWTNSAMEVLEFARRTAARRLADIQAGIILGFLLFHSEGFSTRARCVFASAVAMARDLSLHKIDAPGNERAGSPNQQNALETEIKRRVWWHVAATDWLLALSGGPQEGTYFVQPRHMRVNMPRNIDDEDLLQDSPSIDRPLSEPTNMSYYIQRIKVADICRQVIDKMPLTSFELGSVDYQDVIALDRKFEDFLDNLPSFLKIEERCIRESESIVHSRPHIKIQRYVLGMIAQTRRCKLHQPFLIRRSVQRHYDYSRQISLKSARSVLRMRDILQMDSQGEYVSVTVMHTGVVYHLFMATIVLVMDLCFNKVAEGEDDAARKAEVVAACKMLEDAKSQSAMANEFLESLMNVLRKHQVRLHNHHAPPGQDEVRGLAVEKTLPFAPAHVDLGLSFEGTSGPANEYLPTPDSQQHAMNSTAITSEEISQHYLSDFDTIWKEYVEMGPTMDMGDWDSLFSDLDSRF